MTSSNETWTGRLRQLGSEWSDGISDKLKGVSASSSEDELESNAAPSRRATKSMGHVASSSSSKEVFSLNLETATRDEVVLFVRRQAVHIKRLEERCTQVIEAYKKLTTERNAAIESLKVELADERKCVAQLQQLFDAEREQRVALDESLERVQREHGALVETHRSQIDAAAQQRHSFEHLLQECAQLKSQLHQCEQELALKEQVEQNTDRSDVEQSNSDIGQNNSDVEQKTIDGDVEKVTSGKDDEDRDSLLERIDKLRNLLTVAREHIVKGKQMLNEERDKRKVVDDALEAARRRDDDERAELEKRLRCEVEERVLESIERRANENEELSRRLAEADRLRECLEAEFEQYKIRARMALESSGTAAKSLVAKEEEVQRLVLQVERARAQQRHQEQLMDEIRSAQQSAVALSTEAVQLRAERAELIERVAKQNAQLDRIDEQWRGKLEHAERSRDAMLSSHRQQLDAIEAGSAQLVEQLRGELLALRQRAADDASKNERKIASLLEEQQQQRKLPLASSTASLPPPTPPMSPIASSSAASSAAALASASTSSSSSSAPSSSSLLHVAHMQAQHEREMAECRQRFGELGEEVRDNERMLELHTQQAATLKDRIRELEAGQTRKGTNIEYLKNVVVKYMEKPDEQDRLVGVIATVLHLSKDEVARIEEARARAKRRWF
jgi:GRIP domain